MGYDKLERNLIDIINEITGGQLQMLRHVLGGN